MITIIGAGWYGCYIGLNLKKRGIDFEILERESDIFMGSSGNNQNRLHQGYHYPRDYATRITSLKGFDRFNTKFPGLGVEVQQNLYAIHKDSYIDYQTYLSIYSYENYLFEEINSEAVNSFDNYDGMISVNERLIDFRESRKFFIGQELPISYNTTCKYVGDEIYANDKKIESDIIFDCTYGQLKCPEGYFTEDFLSFVYQKKNEIPFGALTVMNGEFYSIYPYYDELFTVTGVKEGVIDSKEFKKVGSELYISNRRKMLENKILKDYKQFLDDFEYYTYFISKKTKPKGNTDKRATDIIKSGNVYTICSGKIDTIFETDELIESIVEDLAVTNDGL